MIPRSWQPSDATVLRSPTAPHSPKTPTDITNVYVEDGVEQGVWSPNRRQKPRQPSGDVMQTPVIDKMIASERLTRLRESLSNITQTPVRTLHSGEQERCMPVCACVSALVTDRGILYVVV